MPVEVLGNVTTPTIADTDEDSKGVPETLVFIIDAINSYGSPAVNSIGFFFNTMGVVTLLDMGMKTTSSVFMFYLMLVDALANLYVLIFDMFFLNDVNIVYLGTIPCKVFMGCIHFANNVPNLALILFTLDRFASVFCKSYPEKKKKTRLAYRACLVTTSVGLLYFAEALYVYDLQNGRCLFAEYLSPWGAKLHSILPASYSVVQPLTVITLNVAIFYRLRNSTFVVMPKRERDLMKTLLALTTFFILMTILAVILRALGVFVGSDPSWQHVRRLSLFPASLIHATDFILFVNASRQFRNGFLKMMERALLKLDELLTKFCT